MKLRNVINILARDVRKTGDFLCIRSMTILLAARSHKGLSKVISTSFNRAPSLGSLAAALFH